MKTPEEILIDIELDDDFVVFTIEERDVIHKAMEEYGKQQYNQAIKDAAEKCKGRLLDYSTVYIIKDSILKLIKE